MPELRTGRNQSISRNKIDELPGVLRSTGGISQAVTNPPGSDAGSNQKIPGSTEAGGDHRKAEKHGETMKIAFTIPGKPVAKRRNCKKATNEELIAIYAETGSVHATGKRLGMRGSSAHERLVKLGAIDVKNRFSDADVDRLKREYEAAANAGKLADLAADMGRTKTSICTKARALGLTDNRRKRPYLSEEVGSRVKQWISINGHPRGALGMKHNEESKLLISKSLKHTWNCMTDEERSDLGMRQMKAKASKYGTLCPRIQRGTWKAGWRDVGGKRCFFRSRWEANYARYLEWLRSKGQIAAWEHEPEIFWFESIKRGVRSYLPDFRVTENNGISALHEVKGWMDSRSRTTISRMRKYYPDHKLIVVGEKTYRSIERKVLGLIPEWESS